MKTQLQTEVALDACLFARERVEAANGGERNMQFITGVLSGLLWVLGKMPPQDCPVQGTIDKYLELKRKAVEEN